MAARRVTPPPARRRGRTAVFLALAGFLLVTVGVIARRSYGRTLQRDLAGIQRTRSQLSGEVIKLRADIANASGRSVLGPRAESALGMRMPTETQVVDLAVPEVPHVAP